MVTSSAMPQNHGEGKASMLRVPGKPLLVFPKVKIVIREREVQRECWGHQLWGLPELQSLFIATEADEALLRGEVIHG